MTRRQVRLRRERTRWAAYTVIIGLCLLARWSMNYISRQPPRWPRALYTEKAVPHRADVSADAWTDDSMFSFDNGYGQTTTQWVQIYPNECTVDGEADK